MYCMEYLCTAYIGPNFLCFCLGLLWPSPASILPKATCLTCLFEQLSWEEGMLLPTVFEAPPQWQWMCRQDHVVSLIPRPSKLHEKIHGCISALGVYTVFLVLLWESLLQRRNTPRFWFLSDDNCALEMVYLKPLTWILIWFKFI